jgi:hypothetical protein
MPARYSRRPGPPATRSPSPAPDSSAPLPFEERAEWGRRLGGRPRSPGQASPAPRPGPGHPASCRRPQQVCGGLSTSLTSISCFTRSRPHEGRVPSIARRSKRPANGRRSRCCWRTRTHERQSRHRDRGRCPPSCGSRSRHVVTAQTILAACARVPADELEQSVWRVLARPGSWQTCVGSSAGSGPDFLPALNRQRGNDQPGQAPSADARRAGRARRHPGTQRAVGSGRGVARGRRAGGTLAGK